MSTPYVESVRSILESGEHHGEVLTVDFPGASVPDLPKIRPRETRATVGMSGEARPYVLSLLILVFRLIMHI